jgi:hypothetical protein
MAPELARVVEAWAGLPEEVRRAIMALVVEGREGRGR